MRSPTLCRALSGAAVALAGCGAQADSSYRGTALAELHGTVQTSSALSVLPPPLEAALLWGGIAMWADAKASVARPEVGTAVPVSGQFPADFTLQVFTPPSDAALFTCFRTEPSRAGKTAIARIVARRQGAPSIKPSITDLYGSAAEYVVLYSDTNLPAASDCPVGALSKGYHLFKSTPTLDKPGCVRAGVDDPSCNGPWPFVEVPLSTKLTLVLWHEDGKATPPPAPGPPPAGKP